MPYCLEVLMYCIVFTGYTQWKKYKCELLLRDNDTHVIYIP